MIWHMGHKKVLLLMFLLVIWYPFPIAWAAGPNLTARGAILVDVDSGDTLFEQNADVRCYPASVTKIMTLLLAMEAVEQGRASLTDKVRTSEYAASFGGSQVWLEPNEEFSLEEMLIAIAVGSANDASVAVAEHLSGTHEAFVSKMNKRARELGAKNTNFINAHGLHDDNHYTTPRDVALMAREAARYPKILELTSIKEYTFREVPKLVLYNTNKLLWWYPGTLGLKTGTTSQAGRSLASVVERDGLRLLGVVMGVDRAKGHFAESMSLYNYGFAQYAYKQFFGPGERVAEIKVGKGSQETIGVVPLQKVGTSYLKGKSETLKTQLILPQEVTAPIAQGQVLGQVVVFKDTREVARINLVAEAPVSRGTLARQVNKVWTKVISGE